MRPGPPISALCGPLRWGVKVDVYRSGRVIYSDLPVSDAKFEWSDTRGVPSQVTYECPLEFVPKSALDPCNRFGQRSRVFVICEDPSGIRWRTPIGWFLHTDWDEGSDSVTVTANDLLQVLEDNPMGWPSSPKSGATILSELKRLSEGLPVALNSGVTDRTVPVKTEFGNSRVESVFKLAESYNFGLRVEADGVLHAYPYRDRFSVDAVYEMRAANGGTGNGLLLSAPDAPIGDKRRPNRWIVTATHHEGDKEEKWTATRTATDYPFEASGYGWVTSHNEFSAAENKAAVEKAADEYMRKDLGALKSRSLEIVPDPRVEVGDVVAAVTDSERIVGRVKAFSMPLSDTNSTMRVDIDVLAW